eukprot:4977513-Pleurochrysis_carterae.AAC.1
MALAPGRILHAAQGSLNVTVTARNTGQPTIFKCFEAVPAGVATSRGYDLHSEMRTKILPQDPK